MASEYVLEIVDGRLTLIIQQQGQTHHLYAEFVKGKTGYRRAHGGGIKQAIAKAVGLKSRKDTLNILDGTAGLGGDAFVLACLGCHVTMLERSNIMVRLLQDGLARAEKEESLREIVQTRMKLIEQDFKSYITENAATPPFDVIYLDPMFPDRKKSALTKIEMRIIRDIVGIDDDAQTMLALALGYAKKRVVVKRPLHAETLGEKKPDFVVLGSKTRYDVYLTERGTIRINE